MSEEKTVTFKWLLGVVFSFILLGSTFWMNYMASSVRTIEDTIERVRIEQLERTTRIVTLEANYISIQRDLIEIKQTLKELSKK